MNCSRANSDQYRFCPNVVPLRSRFVHCWQVRSAVDLAMTSSFICQFRDYQICLPVAMQITFAPTMMRGDKDLDTGRPNCGEDSPHMLDHIVRFESRAAWFNKGGAEALPRLLGGHRYMADSNPSPSVQALWRDNRARTRGLCPCRDGGRALGSPSSMHSSRLPVARRN